MRETVNTTDCARQRAAAMEIDKALAALRRAARHLTTPEGELAFCGQVQESISGLEHTAGRLRQYAANGW